MKKSTTEKELSEENIKNKKTKIPKEISQELLKKIFFNLLRAIGIMTYFVILNLAYINMNIERLIGDIEVFAGTFLVAGIFVLEKAYKKDSGQTAITAIELLVLSMHSLSIMHMITFYKYDFRLYLLTSSYVFSIYYVLKSIFIYTRGRKEYLNSLSDISEIVKKEEPIIKEAKKRNEEQEKNEKVEEIKEVKVEKTEKTTKPKSIRRIQRKTNTKQETVDKKSQKSNTKKQENDTKKEQVEEAEQKPKKKRGRLKKEVKEND